MRSSCSKVQAAFQVHACGRVRPELRYCDQQSAYQAATRCTPIIRIVHLQGAHSRAVVVRNKERSALLVSAQIQPSCEAYLTATNDTPGNHGLLKVDLRMGRSLTNIKYEQERNTALMALDTEPRHASTCLHINTLHGHECAGSHIDTTHQGFGRVDQIIAGDDSPRAHQAEGQAGAGPDVRQVAQR